jgi:hypothetical protein
MSDDLEAYYSENNPEILLRVRELLHYLLVPVILAIVVVLYLEFFREVGHALHEKLVVAERAILFYFVAEVSLDFVLFDDKREFFREKWFDILLILPFLAAFRAAGRMGRVFQGMRSLQVLQVGEVPIVAGMVAGEGMKGVKIAKYVPKMQKLLHLLRELPAVTSYIPRIQSIVYLGTEAKRFASSASMGITGIGMAGGLLARLSRSRGRSAENDSGDRGSSDRDSGDRDASEREPDDPDPVDGSETASRDAGGESET